MSIATDSTSARWSSGKGCQKASSASRPRPSATWTTVSSSWSLSTVTYSWHFWNEVSSTPTWAGSFGSWRAQPALHDPVGRVPGQSQGPGHGRCAGLLEPIDDQSLEERRKARSRLALGHPDLSHTMLRAVSIKKREDRTTPRADPYN